MARAKTGHCALCGRDTQLTFHHLIPRKMHRRSRFRKRVDRGTLQAGIDICQPCHRGIHRLYDEMTLATHLSTLDALRSDEAIRRHCQWVARQRRA